ncbi:MAG TPA: YceH family protein [Acidobacteriaceae bacterium]|nr:YceH family protein [Acidobacteriaceae bacterium]
MTLDPVQARVLGALMEKEIVTPENYPLSLNALVNACNQKSSRDPVMDLTEDQVQQALHTLEDLSLTATVRDSRVAKFEHRARTVFQLRRDETAVLCLLLLRGPQTPGELRSRSERMYTFDGIDGVESTLARLASTPEPAADAEQPAAQPLRPLVAQLPRQPGSREARFAHLLCGPIESAATTRSNSGLPAAPSPRAEPEIRVAADVLDRIAKLEAEVAELREAFARLTQ